MGTGQVKLAVAGCIALVVLLVVWFVFVPPYNVPKFENIENSETGFLLPLDDGTGGVKHVDSIKMLNEGKIGVKRIQIPKKWNQTGWLPNWGHYLDEKRLVKVDRSTIGKEWTNEPHTGTKAADESISAQSKDGMAFGCNFNCTAYIPEASPDNPEGAEHFLYYYKGDSLGHIMDSEVRIRVQSVTSDFASKFTFEQLRGTQHELVEAVRADVVPFFKGRGIGITKLGMIGGFHPRNPAIQKSIDDAIAAQQLKITALAMQEQEKVQQATKLQNQEIDNKTLIMAAEGVARAAIARAEGEAKAQLAAVNVQIEVAKAKAMAIRTEADAEAYKYQQLEKTKDFILSLRNIEMETLWRSRWTGGVPATIMQGSGTTIPIFPVELKNK
jgi:hypothetical protein